MNDKIMPPAKTQTMDYAQLLAILEKASAFDLFRLKDVIAKELESPQRLKHIKRQLVVGQRLSYFDTASNSLHPCEIIKLNQKKALIKDFTDGSEWYVRYYMLNIEGADSSVNHEVEKGLSRHALSVNDVVGFKDKHGIEHTGKIIRLNPKSVTLHCKGEQVGQWRVSYALLYRVLDGEAGSLSQPNTIGNNSASPMGRELKTIEGTVIQ